MRDSRQLRSALFGIVMYCVGFPKKKSTDMQRNHAGLNTKINYV